MKEALRPRYTFEEYLDIESRSSAVKHEYVAGEVFAMAGGSVEHSALSTSLCGLLIAHLRGGPCRPHGPDLRIHIESVDVATYADVSVVCAGARTPHHRRHGLEPARPGPGQRRRARRPRRGVVVAASTIGSTTAERSQRSP